MNERIDPDEIIKLTRRDFLATARLTAQQICKRDCTQSVNELPAISGHRQTHLR